MSNTRSKRLRQRKHRRQVLRQLALIALGPPALAGLIFWGLSKIRVEQSSPTRQAAVPRSIAAETGSSLEPRPSRSRASASPAPDRKPNRRRDPNIQPVTRQQRESGLTVVELSSSPSARPPRADSAALTSRQSADGDTPAHRVPVPIENIFESSLPLHAHNQVDDAVFAKLIQLGIQPAKRCSDGAFLRRVYIDVTGTLPSALEAKSFLQNTHPRKREKLIDTLLEREEYADYWAMKWCDILRVKAEFPINLWPNGAQAYHRWLRAAIANNMPYDQFARELLTSSGSNFRTPQVNFYRAMQGKDFETIAKTVALTFMASRAEKWPPEQLAGMSAFFTQVGFKPTGEWKEEIIYFNPRASTPTGKPLRYVFPSGQSTEIPPRTDPRTVFADWLVHKKNPWFARAMVNRVWYWLFGRGIVDPPDDVRRGNPATNQKLLNQLADAFVAADYDIKALLRLILRSSTYQLSCIDHSSDPHAGSYFAFYQPRRHDAEVLIDAICQITGTHETYMSIIPEPFTFLPDTQRAIAIPDGSITSSFLEIFGRPPRDTGMVSERNNRLTAGQALHLLNSNHIRNKLKHGSGLAKISEQTINTTQKAERIYLTILSRYPSEDEMLIANTWCDDEQGTRELAWALINSDEFLFQH